MDAVDIYIKSIILLGTLEIKSSDANMDTQVKKCTLLTRPFLGCVP
jgi:hypothetical protein